MANGKVLRLTSVHFSAVFRRTKRRIVMRSNDITSRFLSGRFSSNDNRSPLVNGCLCYLEIDARTSVLRKAMQNLHHVVPPDKKSATHGICFPSPMRCRASKMSLSTRCQRRVVVHHLKSRVRDKVFQRRLTLLLLDKERSTQFLCLSSHNSVSSQTFTVYSCCSISNSQLVVCIYRGRYATLIRTLFSELSDLFANFLQCHAW